MENPYVAPLEQGRVVPALISIPDQLLSPGEIVRVSGRFFVTFFPQIFIITLVIYGPVDILLQVLGLDVDFSNASRTRTYFRVIQVFEFFIGSRR